MGCSCNNKKNSGGVIPWVRGNRLPLIICVFENVVTQEQVGDSTLTVNEMTRVPYTIQDNDTVTVIMKSGFRQVEMPFTTDGNKVMVTDNGELPTGAYTVEVTIERGDGARGRWQETRQVRIYENTSDAQLGEMYSIDADLFFYAKGDTGTGIADITNNPDGTLTITMTDGTSYTTDALKGDKGDKGDTGERGVSIVSFDVTGQTDVSVIYTVTFSDDTTQDVAVPKGPQGDTGLTGNGISTTTLNSDYTLTIAYTDGTTYTTPSIRGAQGAQGVSVIGFTQTGETATNTMYNLVLSDGRTQSVAIPKGTKGDKGDTGNTGAQGAQGPKGDTVTATDYTLYNVQGSDSQGAMSQDATTKAISAQTGYYTCGTAEGTAEKVVTVESGNLYKRTLGGHFKVKMTSANTAASGVTLQVGSETAAALWYNGAAVSASNTWEGGEVISVYYDGTYYQASNAQGGGGNAEKIKYDNSQSGLAATDVQGALDETNILNESENLFDVTTAESNNSSSVYYLVTFDTANITTTVSTRIKITENGIAGGIKCTWMEVGAIYKFDLDYTNNISGASIKKDSYTSNTLAVGSGHLSFTVRNNGGNLLVKLPKNTAASKSCVISNLSITKIDYLKDTVNGHEERLGGVELKTIADVPVDFIGNTQTISYYIATQSGYWIAYSSSYPYNCKILQIQTNTNYRLTAENDNPVSYALLTNNTPHTDNVQATNWNGGVPASLAAGESVVINSGEYTYLYCRNNNGSTASDFKYPQKIEQLEPVDKAVEKNIDAIALLNSAVISEPLVIPYGSMTYNNGFISPSQKKWVTGTGYEHYYFARTSDMKEISVKGKSGTYTYISFLQSYNYVGTPSGTPVFCAGYDAPRQFFETSTPQDTVKIPSDCNYIVVNISYPGTSQLPEAVYIGYDLKDAVVYKNNVNSTFHIPMEVGYIATDTGVNPIFSGDAGISNGYAYSTTEGEFRYWRNVGLIDVDGGEYTISFDNGDLCWVFFYDYLRNFIKVVYYGTTEDVSSVTINANGAKYLRIVIMTKADTYAQDQRLDIMPNPNAIINGVFIGGLKISKLKKQNTNPADTIITPVWIENTFASLDSTQEVQDDGEWHIDYGRLALPPNYDPDGEPVRLIIYSHGGNPRYNPVFNGDSSYTYVTGDFSRTNHIDPTLFLKEGYAVMDMDACFAIFNVKDIEGIYIINGRQVANCYQAAYDYVIRNYNIRTDGVLLGGLSFGSERSLQIITWSNIPILAAALHSPYVGEPRLWSIGYRKPLSKHAGFTDYDDVAIGNINAAQLALLEENYPKLLRTSPIFAMCHVSKEDFFATHTIDIGGVSTQVSLLDGYVNWGTYVVSTWAAHFNVPIKMWAGTADTTAIIAEHAAILYSVGINGGSDIILRIVNGAKHVPTVGSDIITIPSYVTKYGETLTNVSMIYVETLRYWRRYEQK